jgi:hypothetical protein
MTKMDDLALLWEELLSQDPARIRSAWNNLTDDECLAVLAHLKRMRDEDGWSPAQRAAASDALRALRDQAQ